MAHRNSHQIAWLTLSLTVALAACGSSSEDEPKFGAAEMQAAAVGDFTGTLATDTQPTSLNLHLEHAPPGSAPACSNRTLGMSPQCVDMTTLGLRGTITTGDGKLSQTPITGSFMAFGLELTSAELRLNLPQGALLTATWSSGKFNECSVTDGTSKARACTIAR